MLHVQGTALLLVFRSKKRNPYLMKTRPRLERLCTKWYMRHGARAWDHLPLDRFQNGSTKAWLVATRTKDFASFPKGC